MGSVDYGRNGVDKLCTRPGLLSIARSSGPRHAPASLQHGGWRCAGAESGGRRRPQLDAMYRQHQDVQRELLEALAIGFDATVQEIQGSAVTSAFHPLPPLMSLFLDRLRGRDAATALLGLRRDLRPLRDPLRLLTNELENSTDLRSRLSARRRFSTVLAELNVASPRTDAVFEQTIRYAPEVTRQLVDPFNTASFKAELLRQPMEWLRRWWVTRPYRMAYRARDMLMRIQSYERLVADAFGLDLQPEASEGFYRRYMRSVDLYRLEE